MSGKINIFIPGGLSVGDVVVILDELSTMDVHTYNSMLDTMSHRDLVCGFLSGKNEIMNWEPSDLFRFVMIRLKSKEVLTRCWLLLTKVL